MTPEPNETAKNKSATQDELTVDEQASLNDAENQARYRKEYLEQQAKRACPGCGESIFLD